ncbi:MAG: tetratricopeptide repeat protein [Verrucomicrobiia bacterium]
MRVVPSCHAFGRLVSSPGPFLTGVLLAWTIFFAPMFHALCFGADRSAQGDLRSGTLSAEVQLQAAALKQSAVDIAHQLVDAYPQDALTHALLGSANYNTGRSAEATKNLEKCLELNPNQADAYEILGRIAYEKAQLEEAVRLCNEALKRGPPNPDLLNQLGRAYMDLGRTEEAVATLEKAVKLPRPTSESSYLLGQARLQARQYAGAKESFQRAIALLPDHTQAFFGLYTACMRLGQTEEAARYREQFQKLEAIDRKTLTNRSAQEDTLTGLPLVRQTVARTVFGAGQVYSLHNENAKAAELFRKAAALDDENIVYRAALESSFVSRKAEVEGVKVFSQLAAEQPGSVLNHFFLGRLHARLNQFDAAERAYRTVLDSAPDWTQASRALVELYLRADQKPAEARTLAKRLVELEPTGPNYYLLGVACLKNNDRPGALEAIKQAAARSPNEPRFKQLLQQLEQAR